MLKITLFIVVNVLLGAVQALAADHAVILQYHHVAERTPPATSVSPALFEQQMQFLKDNGFSVWPLSRLVRELEAGRPVPDGVVVITFDDAYDNILTTAAPILQRLGFPFTMFVATSFVDHQQRGYMSWAQLQTLKTLGGELANHTHTHPHMLRRRQGENRDQWLARLRDEIQAAQQRLLLQTGDFPRLFAYPYGEADEEVIALVKSLGYTAFGQQSGAVDRRALAGGMAPRFPFNVHYADMTEFQHKASSVPLPIQKQEADAMLWQKAGRPVLSLTLAPEVKQLSCFASGQGAIPVQREADNRFVVQAPAAIPVGRSRYNCTAPVAAAAGLSLDLKPRFYWYSHQWIRKRDDGSWYSEP